MKSRTFAFASLLALSALAVGPVAQPAMAQEEPLKIAVVNMDQVVAESAAGSALNEKLKAFQEEAQGQVQEQQERIQELRQQIADGVNSEDKAQLTNLQKLYEDATVQLQRFRDDKQREANKIRAEGLQEIQQQFNPVFDEIQAEHNYDLVLNKQTGIVLLVGDRVDITQMVIDKLK